MALWNTEGGNEEQKWDLREGSLEEVAFNLRLEICRWDKTMGKNDGVR